MTTTSPAHEADNSTPRITGASDAVEPVSSPAVSPGDSAGTNDTGATPPKTTYMAGHETIRRRIEEVRPEEPDALTRLFDPDPVSVAAPTVAAPLADDTERRLNAELQAEVIALRGQVEQLEAERRTRIAQEWDDFGTLVGVITQRFGRKLAAFRAEFETMRLELTRRATVIADQERTIRELRGGRR